jgi:hypothetical protein
MPAMLSLPSAFLTTFQDAQHALLHLCGTRECTPVAAEEMPPVPRKLLAHRGHMTAVLQAHFGGPVQLHVHGERLTGAAYKRHISLTLVDRPEILEYGVVRVHLAFLSDAVQEEILARAAPLGRILIEHDVMRRVEPLHYVRLPAGGAVMQQFAMAHYPVTIPDHDIYGRLAVIFCNDQPAIELLETVTEL